MAPGSSLSDTAKSASLVHRGQLTDSIVKVNRHAHCPQDLLTQTWLNTFFFKEASRIDLALLLPLVAPVSPGAGQSGASPTLRPAVALDDLRQRKGNKKDDSKFLAVPG